MNASRTDSSLSHDAGAVMLHRRLASRAVRLEMRGDWPAAAAQWLRVCESAPLELWRQFARERVAFCRKRGRTSW